MKGQKNEQVAESGLILTTGINFIPINHTQPPQDQETRLTHTQMCQIKETAFKNDKSQRKLADDHKILKINQFYDNLRQRSQNYEVKSGLFGPKLNFERLYH